MDIYKQITFIRKGVGLTQAECYECKRYGICRYLPEAEKFISPSGKYTIVFDCISYEKDK
jgi:hypothetical protein